MGWKTCSEWPEKSWKELEMSVYLMCENRICIGLVTCGCTFEKGLDRQQMLIFALTE